ncbi:MAG: SDR family oxidoreductase [Eubacteriales bacterium]
MKKVAIVSGASSGIGRETAVMLTKGGYTVYAFNRKQTEIAGVEFVPVDVAKIDTIQQGVAAVLAREGRIDLLVNNAGMGISGALENTPDESAAYIFDVNFFGAFRLAREVIPTMRENGGGRIINVSSLAAVFNLPFQGFYSASKAAVNSLFISMQLEVKPFNIKITNVMPGDIKNGFTDNRKKNDLVNPAYRDRIKKSVAIMEKDEVNGMPPTAVARVIVRQAKSNKPKFAVVVGFKYKFLFMLSKLLPAGLVNNIIYSIYGGGK